MSSFPEDDLTPQQLIGRAAVAGLMLSTAALTTEAMDGHRASAYANATHLAEVAIKAAQALLEQPSAQVQAQLVELSGELATRVAALEASREQ